jgi:hypothetical protein
METRNEKERSERSSLAASSGYCGLGLGYMATSHAFLIPFAFWNRNSDRAQIPKRLRDA